MDLTYFGVFLLITINMEMYLIRLFLKVAYDVHYCRKIVLFQITYEDIRKTYGGSGSSRSGGYYSSWSYSANAYMLMYRRVDRERNVNSLTAEEFPQHIKVGLCH